MRSTSRFAEYKPRPGGTKARRRARADAQIVAATKRDADAIARLTFEREGGTYQAARKRVDRWLAAATKDSKNLMLVARVGRSVVGYGRAGFVRGRTDEDTDVPEGWYLGGVVVAPLLRRRVIVTLLTRRRIEWIAERGATEVYYFVNSLNRASIELHTPFGFIEVRRDFRFPGVTFSGGGTGVLFRAAVPDATEQLEPGRVAPGRGGAA
jgi:ribosomal protein S18 acetylase RimI-like enzyme